MLMPYNGNGLEKTIVSFGLEKKLVSLFFNLLRPRIFKTIV